MMMTRKIQLSRGMAALVDNDDYAWLSQWKWFAKQAQKKFYATRIVTVGVREGERYDDGKKKYWRKDVSMHRLIMKFPTGLTVDHINGNGLDNRRTNLRLATTSQNCAWKPAHGATSKFKGVAFDKKRKKWVATVQAMKRFDTEIEAAKEYDRIARFVHGEFAWQNFPLPQPEPDDD